MKDYKLKTYIPTISSFCYAPEIKNRELIDINKFISSNDDKGLSMYLESLIEDCNLKNSFDKVFCLMNIRMVCKGNEVKLQISKPGEALSTLTVYIISILGRLLDNIQGNLPDYENEDLKIKFNLPKKLYHNNFPSFLFDIVEDLTVKGTIENYKELSDTNKKQILLKLRKEIITDIKEYIKNNQIYYNIIKLDDSSIDFAKKTISFYDNSKFYLLKFLFKSNISSTYNKLFHCCQKLNLTYSDFLNLTSSETDLLLTIYKKNLSIK
jgi:hypothetical protein